MSDNPLIQTLRARIPGETFRLPSQGLFYKNGELDESVKNGEVHVYPMTSIDEIVFKTPDKLLSGDAVSETFRRCMPQVLKPADLFAKDVDYLLMCLRMLSYGPELELTYKHNCENAKDHNYKVELRPILQKAKAIDPTTIMDQFTLILGSGQLVKMQPPLFKNVIAVYQTTVLSGNNESLGDDEIKKLHSQLLDVLANMIVSVDEIADRAMILEWAAALPPSMLKEIQDKTDMISSWGIDPTHKIVCQDCKKEVEIDVPVNPISFFI